MKLNNKGLTVIELILSFTLLVILVFGMFNVVVDIKDYSEMKEFDKDMNEFKNRIIYIIQTDLIDNSLSPSDIKIYPSESTSCPSELGSSLASSYCVSFGNKILGIDLQNKVIVYGGKTYKIPHSNEIEFLDSRVINLCAESTKSVKNKSECGSSWTGKFDTYKNVTITNDKTNKILTIDVPYFEIDGTVNYGFKIVHAYGLN